MDVIIRPTDEVGITAAQLIAARVRAKPDCVLGLATGSTPLPIYAELSRMVAAGELSLARCSGYLLDEYLGLRPDHPEGYRNFIERELVARTDIDTAAVHALDGATTDAATTCAAFEQAIARAGGVDIQILGVGSNGHIAFNEPGSALDSRTRTIELTEQTRRDNSRFFDHDLDEMPTLALSQGLGTIMEARELVLVVTGAHKAEAVHHLLHDEPSVQWPVTALHYHPHATVVVDEAAAAGV